MVARVYQPPAVWYACGLGVRMDLQESIFVRVAVWHEWVVVVNTIGTVGVAFAVTRVVCGQKAAYLIDSQTCKKSHDTS